MKRMVAWLVMIVLCVCGCSAGDGSEAPKTAFTLSQKVMEMPVGTSRTLTAQADGREIAPQDLWWQTTDETVAAVENGKVQARAEGQALITASNRGGYMVLCRITVTEAQTAS